MQPQRMVSRAEARVTRLAVAIGALQRYLAQSGLRALGPSAAIARLLATDAPKNRPDVIGCVCVEPSLHCPSRDAQHTPARRRLDRFDVQAVDRARTYEPFDLRHDFRVEGLFEAPIMATSCPAATAESSSASAHCSQACQ